ncbi:hypothetical protein ACXNSR_38670 [Streptomyces sp. NC-S4]
MAISVVDHPHWATVAREEAVSAHMQLMKQGHAEDPAESEAAQDAWRRRLGHALGQVPRARASRSLWSTAV